MEKLLMYGDASKMIFPWEKRDMHCWFKFWSKGSYHRWSVFFGLVG